MLYVGASYVFTVFPNQVVPKLYVVYMTLRELIDQEMYTEEKGKGHQKKVEVTSSRNSQVLPFTTIFSNIADPREHVILQLSDCTSICD